MPGHYNGLPNKLKIVNFFPCQCSESQNNIAPKKISIIIFMLESTSLLWDSLIESTYNYWYYT